MMKASPRAQVNRKDNSQYLGKINLIDLAGSENVNKSGVQGPTPRRVSTILIKGLQGNTDTTGAT